MHTAQKDETLLLTIPDVARRLACSTRTVKRRILDGSIPVVLIGEGQRGRRVAVADLEAFIAARTERP